MPAEAVRVDRLPSFFRLSPLTLNLLGGVAVLVLSFWGTLRYLDALRSGPVVLVPAALTGGHLISSGDGSGNPEHAFDGNAETFWISPEKGADVKDRAWIGYMFSKPIGIRRISLEQSERGGYRQDYVKVEKSLNGGRSWISVTPTPVRVEGNVGIIDLPETAEARTWRIVAAGDNVTKPDEAWCPIDIVFFSEKE